MDLFREDIMAGTHATARPHSSARVCTILAFVFAVVAIFFLPPLFGLVGLLLASSARCWATNRSAGTPPRPAWSAACSA